MQVTYTCPSGYSWKLCDEILKQDHVVIAGTTGSGKSTLLHSIIFSALAHSPVTVQFVLIDLKGVELMDYERLPHTLAYADEPDKAVRALEYAVKVMRNRIEEMKRNHKKMYTGADLYVIIDEMAVLMQTSKAKSLPLLADLMRLGRAAKVHVIGATQNPSRSSGGGLPSTIAQNTTSALCLRVRSSIESRQVCGVSGGELLPKHGEGIFWSADGTNHVAIPQTPDPDINERVTYWLRQRPQRVLKKEESCSRSGLFSRFSHAFSH